MEIVRWGIGSQGTQSLNPYGPYVDHAVDILYHTFHQQERLIQDGHFVLFEDIRHDDRV